MTERLFSAHMFAEQAFHVKDPLEKKAFLALGSSRECHTPLKGCTP